MGILHVAFNMLAFVPIGQSLERLVGTIQVLRKCDGAESLMSALILGQVTVLFGRAASQRSAVNVSQHPAHDMLHICCFALPHGVSLGPKDQSTWLPLTRLAPAAQY